MKNIFKIISVLAFITFLFFVAKAYTSINETLDFVERFIDSHYSSEDSLSSKMKTGYNWLFLAIASLGIGFLVSFVKDLLLSIDNGVKAGVQDLVNPLAGVAIEVEKVEDKPKEKLEFEGKITDLTNQLKQELSTLKTLSTEEDWEKLLQKIVQKIEASVGIIYTPSKSNILYAQAAFAHVFNDEESRKNSATEGLVGQVAKTKKILNIDNIPDNYIKIETGLGKSTPKHILIFPVSNTKGELKAVIEIASFKKFDASAEELVKELAVVIYDKIALQKNNNE